MTNDIRIGTMVNQGTRSDDYIRKILPHGFESFQLSFWQELGGTDLEELAPRVMEALGDSGASMSSLSVFGNPLEIDEMSAKTVAGWEACIDHAHLFGADMVGGFAGRLRSKPLPESIPRFKQVFGELAKRAADKGVRIVFENCSMGGNWHLGDWNIAYCPDAWELMFDALPDDHLGLEWEPCHPLTQLINPLPQLRKWLPKIFHVHGKDANVYHDVIARHGIASSKPFCHHRHPGFGDTDWKLIIGELRKFGYKGSIDIEGWHDPVYCDELEMTGQVHALNYLKECRTAFVPNPA
jgi:sugar phosphate isomerase/epimerase